MREDRLCCWRCCLRPPVNEPSGIGAKLGGIGCELFRLAAKRRDSLRLKAMFTMWVESRSRLCLAEEEDDFDEAVPGGNPGRPVSMYLLTWSSYITPSPCVAIPVEEDEPVDLEITVVSSLCEAAYGLWRRLFPDLSSGGFDPGTRPRGCALEVCNCSVISSTPEPVATFFIGLNGV